jgi:hypothetical protein
MGNYFVTQYRSSGKGDLARWVNSEEAHKLHDQQFQRKFENKEMYNHHMIS